MWYAGANYLAMGFSVVVSLVSKSLLGVAGAGQWTFFKTCSAYGEYSDLGVKDALLREVSQARGAGKTGEADLLRSNAFFFVGFGAACSLIVLSVAGFLHADGQLRTGYALTGVLTALSQFYSLGVVLLRVEKRMGALSALIVFNMAAFALFALSGAWAAGVNGMLAGASAATFTSLVFVAFCLKPDLSRRPSPTVILRLIRTGLPMVAVGYLIATFLTVDSILIARYIGFAPLGFYSIGLMAVQQIGSIGRFAQIILLPHLQEKYGATGNAGESASLYWRFTDALAHHLPFLISLVGFGVPVIVHYFLQRFEPGVPSMKILILGFFFIAAGEISTSILFTLNKQRKLILPLSLLLTAEIFAVAWTARTFGSIEAIALLTSAAYAAAFTLIYFECFGELEPAGVLWKRYAGIWAIFGYFAAAFLAADRWISTGSVIGDAALKCSAVWAAWAPFWWRFERREPVLGPVLRILGRGRSR